jgi:hypothetical protein
MERARIMLIIAHAVIVRVSHHAIAGGVTGLQINPPLKTVAISASPTEIARIAIDIVSVLLIVTTSPGLALPNQVCAISMSSVTMNTNTGAIQTELIDLNPVQLIAKTLSTPAHARNLASAINTGAPGEAVLIAILDRPTVSSLTVHPRVVLTVINGHLARGHLIQPALQHQAEKPKPGRVHPGCAPLVLNHHSVGLSGQRRKNNLSQFNILGVTST